VRMRSRKPCVLDRRRLFGWNVRLLTCTSPRWYVHGKGCTRTPPGTRSEPARAALRARRNCLLSSLDTVRRRADQGQTKPFSTGCGQLLWTRRASHQACDSGATRPRVPLSTAVDGSLPVGPRPAPRGTARTAARRW
jgi:hypothetical protein